MKNYYAVGVYCVALVVAFIYPPYEYNGKFSSWDFIWEISGGYQIQISYLVLGIEIGIATLIFLAVIFFGKKQGKLNVHRFV